MSFLIAAVWSIAALFALDFVTTILILARPAAQSDLVSRVLCQAIAFVGTLFFLAFVHEREKPLSEILGLRRTSVWLYLIAGVLGALLQGPLGLMTDAIYTRFPLPQDEMDALTELFSAPAIHQKIALVVAAGVVGPLVEELFFRGAIWGGVRKRHTAPLSLFGVSLLFAAAHRDWRNFGPDFLGGLAMGYVRMLSGSLGPAIVLHAAFNSISVIFALRSGPDGDVLTKAQSLAALPAALLLVWLFREVARRSALAARAREKDVR